MSTSPRHRDHCGTPLHWHFLYTVVLKCRWERKKYPINLFFQLQRLISDRRSTFTKPKGYQILDFLKLDWMLEVSDPLGIPFVRYKTACKMTDLLSVSKFAVFETVLYPLYSAYSMNIDKACTFLDYLPTSSCKHIFWTPPYLELQCTHMCVCIHTYTYCIHLNIFSMYILDCKSFWCSE